MSKRLVTLNATQRPDSKSGGRKVVLVRVQPGAPRFAFGSAWHSHITWPPHISGHRTGLL
jgi:hypothetical protein